LPNEVVVIGAGAVGGSVAFRLAQAGARVTVLDAGEPGSGTSGSSFAWLNSGDKQPREYHDLNVAGMREHRALADELGGRWYHGGGNLDWAATDAGREKLRQRVARLQEWGYAAEWLTPERVLGELEPRLALDRDEGRSIAYFPEEGWVDGQLLARALAGAIERGGGRVLGGRQVARIESAGGRVAGVGTQDGDRFAADVVVNCAGQHADAVARLAGGDVPLANTLGLLAITSAGPPVVSRVVHAPNVHLRPDSGGGVMLHVEEIDRELARDTVVNVNLAGCSELLRRAVELVPSLGGRTIVEARIGTRPIPKDGLPAVGPAGSDGHYVVVTHSGITLGPLLGRIVAAEIIGGTPDSRLAPFRPERLHESVAQARGARS